MRIPNIISLDATFFSGQAFRWRGTERGFIGSVQDNAALILNTQEGYELSWDGPADEAYWRRYFDLDRDYQEIARRFCGDAHSSQAFSCASGLRVLNQPVWETLCAFIVSANNNDKRIRLILGRLSESLGRAGSVMGQKVFFFPTPRELAEAGEEGLRAHGAGYRARYLCETAKRAAAGYDFEKLKTMGYEAALKELMTFPGVGEKVADCVLLFSCGYSCAFPVDVWVARVMKSLYAAEGGKKRIKAQGAALFGADAGIVQQMLFHSARTGALKL